MTLLIVEDEIRIREGLCRLLGKQFPEIEIVAVAENGLEGLAYLEYHKPDMVITDIKMPGMDGLEMLTKAQALGLSPKVIVLTAYSEFAYAQQAVRLGVCDYLVKPIVMQEFVQTVRKLQALCEQERKRTPETVGSLESILSVVLHNSSPLDPDTADFLEKAYGLGPEDSLLELLFYLGDCFSARREAVRKRIEGLLGNRNLGGFCLIDVEYDKSVLALVYGYPSRQDFETWYQYQIRLWQREAPEENLAFGITEVPCASGIREGYQQLEGHMDWSLSLGEGALISCPEITRLQTEVCVYPIELENQMKISICAGDLPRVRRLSEQFRQYLSGVKIYTPEEIKDSYVRFLWSLLSIAKEVGHIDSQRLEPRDVLDRTMSARTARELSRPFEEVLSALRLPSLESEGVSLTIKKAQRMIHEFYSSGVTLGEIANRLNMSQEYLGTQFHKEVGEPFSVYIRSYRLSKAKELLIGTQFKQYEIAEKVGYTDAKYFARVFKECVGMSPAEYRKSHK